MQSVSPRSQRRWWKRGALTIVTIACLASATAAIVISMSPGDTNSQLTHTITRDDLVVTVTAQGILESSDNSEIKCQVNGRSTVIWVIENGTVVEKGDELVRLDTLLIEEQIDQRTKYAHWSRSSAERSAANVASAQLKVSQYEQGTYVASLMKLQKDLVVAESKLRSAENILQHTRLMAQSNYKSNIEVEEKEFAVEQAQLDVKLKKTEIDVLKRFTRNERLQSLRGELAAAQATHKANAERSTADASRRDRALKEFENCVVRAPQSGMVIHPNIAKWLTAPIAEGSTVRKDQVLLRMPDLAKMQVKLNIHESLVDRLEKGLPAKVSLPNMTIDGTVSSVASIAKPASIWSGYEVKYDTYIELPSAKGLMPGMSAEVEVIVARHEDVLTIPVAAITETEAESDVETEEEYFCWVKTPTGVERRQLALGDSNGVFTVVEKGLKAGDEVILNPRAYTRTPPSETKTIVQTRSPATGPGNQ